MTAIHDSNIGKHKGAIGHQKDQLRGYLIGVKQVQSAHFNNLNYIMNIIITIWTVVVKQNLLSRTFLYPLKFQFGPVQQAQKWTYKIENWFRTPVPPHKSLIPSWKIGTFLTYYSKEFEHYDSHFKGIEQVNQVHFFSIWVQIICAHGQNKKN